MCKECMTGGSFIAFGKECIQVRVMNVRISVHHLQQCPIGLLTRGTLLLGRCGVNVVLERGSVDCAVSGVTVISVYWSEFC